MYRHVNVFILSTNVARCTILASDWHFNFFKDVMDELEILDLAFEHVNCIRNQLD